MVLLLFGCIDSHSFKPILLFESDDTKKLESRKEVPTQKVVSTLFGLYVFLVFLDYLVPCCLCDLLSLTFLIFRAFSFLC